MARVKRGVTSHAKHKKVLKAVKGQWGRRKNTIRVASKRWKKQCNMLIEIVELKKEILDLCGYRESTQELELRV